MSRGVLALDRVVLAVLGLLLLAAGAGLVLWGLGRWPGAPDQLDLGVLRTVPDAPAWPWALAAGGLVAVLVGLRALVAHAYRRRVRQVPLGGGPDAAPGGRLVLDLPAAARAAAQAMEREAEVEQARGRVVVDRGRTVVELAARVDAGTDLARVRTVVDRTHAGLAALLPPGTAQLRVRLDVHRARADNARVS